MKTALCFFLIATDLLLVSSDSATATTTTTANRDVALIINATAHIVGGQTARTNTHGYYAIPDGSFLCGATLIHPDILLTAAHCNGRLTSFLTSGRGGGGGVYIGPTKADGSDAREQLDVTLVRIHPEFTMDSLRNDVALVKLQSPSTAPVAPWNENPLIPAPDSTVTVVGFGYTQDGGSLSYDLQEVDVQIVNSDTCAKAYSSSLDKTVMICAGAKGKDACQGDSGGPLLQDGVVVGLVSFGVGCATPGYPGVYANVAAASDFIRTGICEMSDFPPASCAQIGQQSDREESGLCNICGVGTMPSGVQLRRTNLLGHCNEMCVGFAAFAWKLIGWECGRCP